MNTLKKLVGKRDKKRGIALVTVLAVLTLAAVMILAFFSVSRTELQSATTYSHGLEAQQLSKTAIDLVMHQIRTATSDPRVTWANQPGMIRTWDEDGFDMGFKLYSDDEMVISDEGKLDEDSTELANWQSLEAQYVDLNEPVIRDEELFYPIVDPRAYSQSNHEQSVEGFSYDTDSTGRGPSGQALPMPVKWVYQLEDGTLGTLDSSKKFEPLAGDQTQGIPARDNPIVARLAFWADDECAKINVNTAAGGRAWDVPRAGGEIDRNYGLKQPLQREYQRYPAHPAQTQLSPVLFPNRLEWGQSGYDVVAQETIYQLIPRITGGGSRGGDRDFKEEETPPPLVTDKDRLYATIDEFIFKAPELEFDPDTGAIVSSAARLRLPRKTHGEIGSWGEIDAEFLDKVKFFLTVNSRAPETTVFNTPRISVWPSFFGNPSSGSSVGGMYSGLKYNQMFSAFDKRIRFCAEVGEGPSYSTNDGRKAQYHFQRFDSESRTHDYDGIERNKDLYGYLQWLTSQPIPGVGVSMREKYDQYDRDENDQILTEIFDYIRSLNLFDDSLLAQQKLNPATYVKQEDRKTAYGYSDWVKGNPEKGNPSNHPSFTNLRVDFAQGSRQGHYQHQGHGQVAPIQIGNTKGFGRFFGLMEAGIAIICTAEGSGEIGGPRKARIIAGNAPDEWTESTTDFFYSNVCPLTNTDKAYAATVYGVDSAYWDNNPDKWELVRNSDNWNKTLEPDQPLQDGEKRVQPVLLFQLFCPSQGWTAINADFRMEVDVGQGEGNRGSGTWSVDGKSLDLNGRFEYRSSLTPPGLSVWGTRDNGGVLEPRALLVGDREQGGRREYGPLDRYATWTDPSGKISLKDQPGKGGAVGDRTATSYPFVGRPVTINAPANTMDFSGGVIEVRLYAGGGHGSDDSNPSGSNNRDPENNGNTPNYSQKSVIELPSQAIPVPNLSPGKRGHVVGPSGNRRRNPGTETQPPERWTFHREGCMGSVRGGRLWGGRGWRGSSYFITSDDVTRSCSIQHGDYRLSNAQRVVTTAVNGNAVGNNDETAHFVLNKDYKDSGKRIASNFSHGNANTGYGRSNGARPTYVKGLSPNGVWAHLPDTFDPEEFNRWGDFDNTMSVERDGAFINKPDEGNSRGIEIDDYNPYPQWGAVDRPHVPYFNDPWCRNQEGPVSGRPTGSCRDQECSVHCRLG